MYTHDEERPTSRASIQQCNKAAGPSARRGVHVTKPAESQENRSEQTYRPLGDRLGLAEPAQMAYKR